MTLILQQKWGNNSAWYAICKYDEKDIKYAQKRCLDLLDKNRRQNFPGYRSRLTDSKTRERIFPHKKAKGE